MIATVLCAGWLSPAGTGAADYYVATNGNDAAAGNVGNPWATIRKAADSMSAGDTCYLRGGSYHEEVVADGLSDASFLAYPNETVVLDGSLSVEELGFSGWSVHSGDIYKTTLTQDISQVFVDGEWMMLARWPNARFDDSTAWNRDIHWAQGNESMSTNGVEYDDPTDGHDLAASGLDMTDAMLVINLWGIDATMVTNHASGQNWFGYAPEVTYNGSHHYYFMDSKLSLLDNETEWYFDPTDKTLYLWAPGGGIPTGNIRGKTIANAFYLTDCDNIQIQGVNFFASTFQVDGGSYITVEDCDFQYPVFSRRTLGDYAYLARTQILNSHHFTMLNCSMAYTDGVAVRFQSSDYARVENCEFHHIDYTCAHQQGNSSTFWFRGSEHSIFRRNTMYRTGAAHGIIVSSDNTVELNRFSDLAVLQHDAAAVHLMQGHRDVEVNHNWFHDLLRAASRFSDGPKDYLPNPPLMRTGVMHHNVSFNSVPLIAMQFKGDERQCYNNLCQRAIRFSDDSGDPAASGIHSNSVSANNAVGKWISLAGSSYVAPSGTHSHNWEGWLLGSNIVEQVRDWANLDFRPQAGSGWVDSGSNVLGITDGHVGPAPDIGAYESGASTYWIPGRKLSQASSPVPPDNAYGVQAEADLMWLEAYKATSHNVYFGTDPASLVFQGNMTNNVFDPGPLSTGAAHFWRIDAVTPGGAVTGEVWSFTLGSRPVFLADPLTKSFAVDGQAYRSSLANDVVDADGDTIVYSKRSGPVWLNVGEDGALSGAPSTADVGLNEFVVVADDEKEGTDSATVRIEVVEPGTLVLTEYAAPPSENIIAINPVGNGVWNNVTVASNNGASNETMYGQTFIHTNEFMLHSVSFFTGDTKNYGSGQTLELAILEDTGSSGVPDTVVGSVYSVAFETIAGSNPWKTLSLVTPIKLDGNTTYGFVYTLPGPISNNLRATTDSTKSYGGGKAITTSYTAGLFPQPLPPALNSGRDLVFAVQGVPSPAVYYAEWSGGFSISGEEGYSDNPDEDALNNLLEYGLGGAPDNPNDTLGVVPTFMSHRSEVEAGEYMEYVYRRRTDAAARGLTYQLEECTDLLSGDWNAVTNSPTGIAPLGFGFESVTTPFPAPENSLFIRLRITLE